MACSIRRSLFLIAVLLVASTGASAADGAHEIHSACVAQGCFPGDAAGLPVEITTAGRYVLTSNLTLPTVFETGIFVRTNDVTLDLNGFRIAGPNACTYSNGSLTCDALGLSYGVFSDTGVVRTEVRGGSVVGAGLIGVSVGDHSIVRDLRLSWNAGGAVSLGKGSVARDCVVTQNGDGLASTPSAAIGGALGVGIVGNTVFQNRGDGISATTGARIERNVVYENGGSGIETGTGSRIVENNVYENGSHGITSQGGAVQSNSVISNGRDGITVTGSGSRVSGNTVRLNGSGSPIHGVGLQLDAFTTYSDNTVTSNDVSQVVGGVNLGGNYCVGTGTTAATCP